MRMIGLLLVMLAFAGCKGVEGPFKRKEKDTLPPDPLLQIDEQQIRGRAKYGYIEDDQLYPKTFSDRPSPSGR